MGNERHHGPQPLLRIDPSLVHWLLSAALFSACAAMTRAWGAADGSTASAEWGEHERTRREAHEGEEHRIQHRRAHEPSKAKRASDDLQRCARRSLERGTDGA